MREKNGGESQLSRARFCHGAVLLPAGQLLVYAGLTPGTSGSNNFVGDCEIITTNVNGVSTEFEWTMGPQLPAALRHFAMTSVEPS